MYRRGALTGFRGGAAGSCLSRHLSVRPSAGRHVVLGGRLGCLGGGVCEEGGKTSSSRPIELEEGA
jgi:hypothetical protein